MTLHRLSFLVAAFCALVIPSDQGRHRIADDRPGWPLVGAHRWLDAGRREIWPRVAWELPRTTAATPAQAMPAGASSDWLARMQQGLAEREYEARHNGAGLQAPNRVHNLRTYFEPTGIRLVDRTAEGSPELLTLRVVSWGRVADPMTVPAGEVTSAGNRVEIRRPDLVEWYENSAAGLEQGFTLAARPAGAGPVVVEMAVDEACLSQQGDAVVLTAANGRQLKYDGLEVRDAAGIVLAARLEAEDGVIRIAVVDAGARYPLTIDPLLTAIGMLQSNQADAQLGASVAGAGDVNGDGYDDVIVGARFYDAGENGEGAAFVFLGSPSGVADSNPASAVATLQSDQEEANLGGSVAGAGDVNGDGYADVIVGAGLYDAGEQNEGAAFIFLGNPSGVASGNPTTAAAQLESNQTEARLGESVAGAGDVNGDGYSDVILGARFYSAGDANEGAAFIFVGGASGVASGSPATAAATLESNQLDARMGASVVGAGDTNGDGYSDVLVGAPYYDAGETDEGAAFVFMGSVAGVVSGTPATAATTLQSNQPDAALGSSVAAAGDVNGDGYADVIAGAPYYDAGETDEGAAFVFPGGVAGVANGTPATAAAMLQSDQISAELGGSVAGVGDVNGDGYADVIIGAWRYDAGETDEGAAFVYLGSATGLASGNPTSSSATLQSNQPSAGFGDRSVAAAGDVNGDGFGDVLVGAPHYDAGETDEGAAFVFLGRPGGIVSGNPATAAATLQETQMDPYPGMTVAGAGDVNGDSYGDVIVGAEYYDAGRTDEGAAFVLLGSPSGVASGNLASAAALLVSGQHGAGFGASVAGAGDVNGDGYGDVIIGANFYDNGQFNEGAVFIFLGSASGVASGGVGNAATFIQSDEAYGYLGGNGGVAGAGDVNGDGYGDVIIAAGLWYAGQWDEGAAWVFLGSASGVPSGNLTGASAMLQSNREGAYMGRVAGAGDVNGDGYADVIVGARGYQQGFGIGAAFVFMGSANGVMSGNPSTAAATLGGGLLIRAFGASVAGAGDVNGDGYADVIVGAPESNLGQDREGAAFVFLGSASGLSTTAAATLQSYQTEARFGESVRGAGDVNGDGYADVIVGAWRYNGGGAAFVFLGGAGGIANGNPFTAAATVQSAVPLVELGRSVAGAGDVNGDGYADVVVAQDGWDGVAGQGAAHLFQGGGGAKGRPTRAGQSRGVGPNVGPIVPVQAWGGSHDGNLFRIGMHASDPQGRGRVKLEAEACPAGKAFGAAECAHYVSPTWTDVTATSGGVSLEARIDGLALNTLYHWRARVLRAPFGVTQSGIASPPKPAHGPWRRMNGQVVEADIRTGTVPVAVGDLPAPNGGLAISTIRPNPATGVFGVDLMISAGGAARLELFDVAGRRVELRNVRAAAGVRQTILLGGDRVLSAGIYVVRLTQAGRTVSARVAMVH